MSVIYKNGTAYAVGGDIEGHTILNPSGLATTQRSKLQINNTTVTDDAANNKTIITPKSMVGATSAAAGSAGLVPAPASTDADKFLKGNGQWEEAKGGHTILDDEGTAYPERSKLLFSDAEIVDDAVHDVTILTFPFPRLVPWSTASDRQIYDMLQAYYDDIITLDDVKSVWTVGDVRKIHLNEMNAPSPQAAGSKWVAQDISIVILDFDHTELATSINGKTKACITVQTREVLNNNTSIFDTNGHIYVNGDSSYDMTFTKWADLYMRSYLNNDTLTDGIANGVLAAIPSGNFKSAIKPSKHYRHDTYNGNTSELVVDTLFLPSYSEMFGTTSYSNYKVTNPVEGTQFKYYETASNRIKYGNNNGSPNGTKQYWWNGSASSVSLDTSNFGYYWCAVSSSGSTSSYYGSRAGGLAPAFAM